MTTSRRNRAGPRLSAAGRPAAGPRQAGWPGRCGWRGRPGGGGRGRRRPGPGPRPARWCAISRRVAACRADASLALRSCTDGAIPLSAAAVARAVACSGAAEASATLADAAGVSAGQATTAPAAAPARASAEPAAISVSLGGPGGSVCGGALGDPSMGRQEGPLLGRARAVGFHPGTDQPPGSGGVRRRTWRGDRAPGRSQRGGHHMRGVLAATHNARDHIPATET